MATGTVKWFSREKGYGFVSPDGGGDDLFVHFTAVQLGSLHEVVEERRVEFDVVTGERGPQTANLRLV